MTIISKTHVGRTFFDVVNNEIHYTVIKKSINQGTTEWYAIVPSPYQDITNTELGAELILFCQTNGI